MRAAALAIAASVALILPATASALNPVSFSPTGSLNVPRDYPGAATLPDGRVLVAGGGNSGSPYLSSTEIFNPATATFGPGPSMGVARFSPATAGLADGRVLLAGGGAGGDAATAEIFNPATGSFSAVPGTMTEPRYDAGAALLPDGRVLIAGGFYVGAQLDTAEIFNPSTGQFTSASTMGVHRDGPAVVALTDGRVLIAGGYDGTDYLKSAEVFDPATGKFSPIGSMTTARYAPAAAPLPGGRVMIAGGEGDGNGYPVSAEIFDAATNSFSSAGIGSLGGARTETAAAPLADGRVLVAGGYNGTLPTHQLKSAEILSVPSNSFKAKLKGRKVIFNVSNEGTGEATDSSTKLATTAKKKKPKLVKTTTKHGGPGKIVVKIKLTKQGAAKLAQKGKLRIRVAYIPDQGLAATKKLKLRG
jgi:hypothetical protein